MPTHPNAPHVMTFPLAPTMVLPITPLQVAPAKVLVHVTTHHVVPTTALPPPLQHLVPSTSLLGPPPAVNSVTAYLSISIVTFLPHRPTVPSSMATPSINKHYLTMLSHYPSAPPMLVHQPSTTLGLCSNIMAPWPNYPHKPFSTNFPRHLQ